MSSKAEAGAGSDISQAWQVYILECGDGSLYTGITRDLEARVVTHNKGVGAKYTRGRLPVRLIYAEPAPDRAIATQREMAIKKLSRPNKLRLIGSFEPADKASAS
jgi:putative endonuclease